MIGWKCDVGLCPRKVLNNINEVIFTDRDTYFSLTQINNTIPEDVIIGTPSEAYDFLKRYIGNDVDKLYLTSPQFNVQAQVNNVIAALSGPFHSAFPSFNLLYPTMWEMAASLSSIRYIPCYYFRTLNRLYVTDYANTASRVYSVDETGALSDLTGGLAGTGQVGKTVAVTTGSTGVFASYGLGFDSRLEANYDNLTNPASFRQFSILQSAPSGTDVTVRISKIQEESQGSRVFIALFSDNYIPPDAEIPDNPYDPIDPSGPTDPDMPPGTFDDESDLIPDSSLPTISSANTGFTRIYNPTLSQVQDLAKYLWTDDTLIETLWNKIKQYFEDPMQAIIGFNLVPVPVPDAGSKNFALMYIDTGVSMNVAASQFVDRDCGTFKLEPYYGSALDYSPYTKVSAFLPYIGNVQLDVDEVMGRTLQVKYRVDICSGSCVAKILVDGNVLYQYSGHCAINIPFAASDFSSYVQAAISVAKLGVAAAVAAAGGPPPVGTMDPNQQTNQVVTTTQTTETARNPMTGRQITTGTRTTVETREAPASQGSTQASFSALSPANVSNTVGQIMSSKPVVNHSGSFSGNTGYLGVRRPYLIIERPNLCMPQNFQALNGYPSMITMELSTCKGYTRVQQVQLTGLTATNPEQAEIQELLKSGVIF